jgi:hypothetical protein
MNVTTELESIFAGVVTAQGKGKTFQQNIAANADAINALAESATARKAPSTTTRASAVCQISQLIFGLRDDQVVTASDAGFQKEEQVNW